MLKIIFAGTPQFALPALKALLNSPHRICAVYTKQDKPSGRGQKLNPSPVKIFALQENLPLYQPKSLKDPLAQAELKNLNADILVDAACGLLLPHEILTAPKLGCINIHPSLLPRWRGAAPIQRVILAGDTITGVTIMKMDLGLDTGDIYKQTTLPIEPHDTAKTLSEKTAEIGAKLLLEVLNEIESGQAKATPQDDQQSNYAEKITKEEGQISFNKSAIELERMIRAFNPWPVAYLVIDELSVRIWESSVKPDTTSTINQSPGTIIDINKISIDIKTKDGILAIHKIQLPGGKPITAIDLLNSNNQLFTPRKIIK